MLKVIFINAGQDKKLKSDLENNSTLQVVAEINLNEINNKILEKYQADCIVLDNAGIQQIIKYAAQKTNALRQNIVASTHQGIQLLPVNEVYCFQAEHKYVTAFHSKGQLLIDDSLNSLEREFSHDFVRIHRKTLVAIAKIEKLIKDENGQHFVKLRDMRDPLAVSRRQLSKLRSLILCT